VKICQFFKISILIVFITQFTQFAYASGVIISWVENSVSDVAGYKVYYGTASHNYTSDVNAGTSTSVAIDGLTPGVTYYFAVTAYDNSGNQSAYSQEVQATIPNPPVISCSATSLTNSCALGNNASSQTMQVWNSGAGTLNYNVSTNQSWITCTQSSGSSTGVSNKNTLTFNYSTSNLALGIYTATITISASGATNTSQKILVNLTVNTAANATSPASNVTSPSAPTISENAPSSINTTCLKGSNASSQSFAVWNSGGGTLSYTVSGNASWLSLTPSGGTSTGGHGTMTVNFDTSSLAAGNYQATITISASGATNTPQIIPVSLIVSDLITPEQLTFSIDPTSLTISCTQGSDAADQSFQLWNSGNGTLNYFISADADLITISPSSGILTGDHTMITVHLKTSSLAVGEYDKIITITSTDEGVTNSPQTIPVNISVKGAEAESTSGGGDGGGGCFISTSVSGSPNPLMPFFAFLGRGLICIARSSRIFVGKCLLMK